MPRYAPPALHLGGHLQTILAAKCSAAPYPTWQRQRWEWPDEDFCDADWLHPIDTKNDLQAPLLVLFHGLEGSSHSHYARSIGAYFHIRGWRVCVPHFRGCSGQPNRLLRAYHSGDAAEVARMLNRAQTAFPAAPLYAAGVSLGGNALLCLLSELGITELGVNGLDVNVSAVNASAASKVGLNQGDTGHFGLRAAASICAPLDLGRCGDAITTGFANVYTLMFMRTLRAKALEKRARFPKGCDWDAVIASKNLAQFDDVFTAPVHGYHGAADYYARASAKPKLKNITLPTLVLNAQNDPFVPRDVIADLDVSTHVCVEQPEHGGHVGFATASGRLGLSSGELNWLPQRLFHWFTVESTRVQVGNHVQEARRG